MIKEFHFKRFVISILVGLLWLGCSAAGIIFVYEVFWSNSWEISAPIILVILTCMGLMLACAVHYKRPNSGPLVMTVFMVCEILFMLALTISLTTFYILFVDDDGNDDDDNKNKDRHDTLFGILWIIVFYGCYVCSLHLWVCGKRNPCLGSIFPQAGDEEMPIMPDMNNFGGIRQMHHDQDNARNQGYDERERAHRERMARQQREQEEYRRQRQLQAEQRDRERRQARIMLD